MADRVLKILTPATSYDLLSLDELKTSMGIPPADTSQDAQLQMLISRFSDTIATLCNRVFAYEELRETWRCTFYDNANVMKRVFLSHYPVTEADVLSVESPSGTVLDPADYVVEERSGKIELLTYWAEPIVVHYSGGYLLPDDAPPALKQACELLIREEQMLMNRLMTSGIRSIAHKESRIQYYDPLATRSQTTGGAGIGSAANNLLMHYVRLEV
jgi:hypothetical protein